MDLKNSLTKGTVPLMILEILRCGEAYGYEIVKEIARKSGGQLEFGQGTIYPLLYKLEEKGYVTSERKPTSNRKERRYYWITDQGRTYLEQSKQTWTATSRAIDRVLTEEPAGVLV